MNIIQKIKLNNPEKENLQNTLYEIDTLSKRWTGIQKSGESDSEAIQKNIETTISASLSLENIPYTALQIQKIIARQKATNDKKQSLITGYNTVLKALYTHPHNYPLLEGTIVTIHAALFPNGKIHSNDEPDGKPSVVNFLDYKAPTLFSRNQAVSVNNEIRDLVKWTNDELSKHEHHALVVIAAFAYEFISIHPFREGKGELSRILSTLLLLQNGYEWAKFESIDNLIEKRRTEYYGTLKEGQQNRYSSREDISAWILFLCDIWLQSIRNLVPAPLTETPPTLDSTDIPLRNKNITSRSAEPGNPPVYLNARQKRILSFMEDEGPVKVSDIAQALKPVSINTIKKDLLYLRQQSFVEIHGVLKGSIYTLKK